MTIIVINSFTVFNKSGTKQTCLRHHSWVYNVEDELRDFSQFKDQGSQRNASWIRKWSKTFGSPTHYDCQSSIMAVTCLCYLRR